MLALQIFLLIAGLILLVKGADWFVEGSAGIAKKCNISPLVIGLTVVAFGTSMPELAVSVTSAIGHSFFACAERIAETGPSCFDHRKCFACRTRLVGKFPCMV